MPIRNPGLLLLLPLCVLTGCRQELTPAAASALEEQALATRLESDHATVLFAQQELALARSSHAAPAALTHGLLATPQQQAQMHLDAAVMLLKMDEDRAQVQNDVHTWKDFALKVKAFEPQ